MADVLRPWIKPLATEELDVTVEAHSQQTARPQQRERSADGLGNVTLRIALNEREGLTKAFRAVQIIKFLDHSPPIIKAWVSDSQTMILAVFSNDAVKAFETSHQRQRITSGTQGGLIQVKSCELVLQARSDGEHHIGLRIDDSQYLGCGGSSVFGRPLPISKDSSIPPLMDRLLKQDKRSRKKGVQATEEDAEVASTGSAEDDLDDLQGTSQSNGLGHTNTQLPFSTQASTGKRSTAQEKQSKTKRSQKVNKDSGTTQSGQSNGTSTGNGSGVLTRREDLIAILNSKHRPTTAARGSAGPVPPQEQSRTTSSSPDPLHRATKRRTSVGFVQHSRGSTPAWPTYAQPESAKGPAKVASLVNGRSGASSDQTQLAPPNTKSTQRDSASRRRSRHERTTTTEIRSVSEVSPQASTTEHEKTGGPVMRDMQQNDTPPSAQIGLEDVRTEGEPENANVPGGSDDPWKGMTRIRKGDLTIPKDQQNLLDRADCWIPPEPGARGPVANVPIAVLQELSEQAERPLRNSPTASEFGKQQPEADDRSEAASNHSTHQKADGDSDGNSDELPWSSSPSREEEREELPPDSSALGPGEEMNRARPSSSRSRRQGSMVLETEDPQDRRRSNRKRTKEPDESLLEEERQSVKSGQKRTPVEYQPPSSSPILPAVEDLLPKKARRVETDVPAIDNPTITSNHLLGKSGQEEVVVSQQRSSQEVRQNEDSTSQEHPGSKERSAERVGLSSDSDTTSEIESCLPAALCDHHQDDEDGDDQLEQSSEGRDHLSQFNEDQGHHQQQSSEDRNQQHQRSEDPDELHQRNEERGSLFHKSVEDLEGDHPVAAGVMHASKRRTPSAGEEPEGRKARRKRVKVRAAFDLDQEERQIQDPSSLLRQQKQAFLSNFSEAPSGPDDHAELERVVEEQTPTIVLRQESPTSTSPTKQTPHLTRQKEASALSATGDGMGITPSPHPISTNHASNQLPDPETSSRPVTSHDQLSFKQPSRHLRANRNTGLESRRASRARSPTPPDLYEEFKLAYPTYTGSLKTFVMTCALIEWLVEEERMEHRALWDDFVFRYAVDYEPWCQENDVESNTEVPYETFFKEAVDDIICSRHIITPETLLAALQLDPTSAGEMRYIVLGGSRARATPRLSASSPFPVVSKLGSDRRRRSAGLAIRALSHHHPSPSIRSLPPDRRRADDSRRRSSGFNRLPTTEQSHDEDTLMRIMSGAYDTPERLRESDQSPSLKALQKTLCDTLVRLMDDPEELREAASNA